MNPEKQLMYVFAGAEHKRSDSLYRFMQATVDKPRPHQGGSLPKIKYLHVNYSENSEIWRYIL